MCLAEFSQLCEFLLTPLRKRKQKSLQFEVEIENDLNSPLDQIVVSPEVGFSKRKLQDLETCSCSETSESSGASARGSNRLDTFYKPTFRSKLNAAFETVRNKLSKDGTTGKRYLKETR